MVEELSREMDSLQTEYDSLYRASVETPDYYVKPFHVRGPLPPQSRVHTCMLIDLRPPRLTRRGTWGGDAKLRSNFHHRMCDVLRDNGFKVRSMPLP
jgi:hypothetical protein